MAIAETCDTSACECVDASKIQTEFENSAWFCAYDDNITVVGKDDSGAEDDISIELNATPGIDVTYDGASSCPACGYDDSDCDKIADGREDGTLISLSGATIEADGTEVEEPQNSNTDTDILTQVTVTIPEDELRPTIFFGKESSQNSTSLTITDADEGTVVDLGGLDVTVEEFGVTTTGGGVIGGETTTVSCAAQTATCDDVTYSAKGPGTIGYSLVVSDKAADSSKNLVLIGGPSVNAMTDGLVTVEQVCEAAVIEKVSETKLVVAGCEAEETAAAAKVLADWLKAL